MFEYVKRKLDENKNAKYAECNRKLCPDTKREILGVKIPVLRNLAKTIAKDNYQEYLKNVNQDYLEEVILEGLVIAYATIDINEKIKLLKNYIPKIDSWIITDTVCPTIKPKQQDLDKVWQFIQVYIKSKKEFEIRFGVIMMLNYFITDEYVDKVIEKIDSIQTDKYYAQMAIAWVISEIGIKYNEKIIEYLKDKNKLDKFTYNKALQKMIESHRILAEQKEFLKKMKRK